jgi:hypothetical protein
VNSVSRFAIDLVPQRLKLFLLEIRIQRIKLGFAVVADLRHLRGAKNAIDQLEHLLGLRRLSFMDFAQPPVKIMAMGRIG